MKNQNDIFLNNLPSIDLHGFDRESATLAVKDFIHENNIMGNKKVIVIGNEANGVEQKIQDMADVKVKIPMLGKTESLNAAVATSVILYEAKRPNR